MQLYLKVKGLIHKIKAISGNILEMEYFRQDWGGVQLYLVCRKS